MKIHKQAMVVLFLLIGQYISGSKMPSIANPMQSPNHPNSVLNAIKDIRSIDGTIKYKVTKEVIDSFAHNRILRDSYIAGFEHVFDIQFDKDNITAQGSDILYSTDGDLIQISDIIHNIVYDIVHHATAEEMLSFIRKTREMYILSTLENLVNKFFISKSKRGKKQIQEEISEIRNEILVHEISILFLMADESPLKAILKKVLQKVINAYYQEYQITHNTRPCNRFSPELRTIIESSITDISRMDMTVKMAHGDIKDRMRREIKQSMYQNVIDFALFMKHFYSDDAVRYYFRSYEILGYRQKISDEKIKPIMQSLKHKITTTVDKSVLSTTSRSSNQHVL